MSAPYISIKVMYGVDFYMEKRIICRCAACGSRCHDAVVLHSYPIDLAEPEGEQTTLNQAAQGSKEVIVIDPGHGGFDPGKVGTRDTLEKDINLAIAKKVEKSWQTADTSRI